MALACWLTGLTLALPTTAHAQIVIDLDGVIPAGDETHFFVPFEVPPGIAEIEVSNPCNSPC